MTAAVSLIDPPVDTYAQVARDLFDRGWSPLPIPPGTKGPPPQGFTGHTGARPTLAQILKWELDYPGANIAVRVPDDVAGLDIDAYNGGLATLAALEARLGPLPPTIASTSRTDGSGIRFYRVPAGSTFKSSAGPGIDIVQASHRYAVVPPSVHPSGEQYRLIDLGSGEIVDVLPDVGDLVDLTWSWHGELLIPAPKGVGVAQAATPAEVRDFLDEHVENRRPAGLSGVRRRLEDRRAQGRGRHDTLVECACWSMREAAAGWYPAADAVELLENWWAQVMDDPARRDGPELGSAIAWAVAAATAEPDRINELRRKLDQPLDPLDGLIAPAGTSTSSTPAPGLSADSQVDDTDDVDLDVNTFDPIDLTDVLAGWWTQPEPDILERHNGTCLLYSGRVNIIHGDSGTGKSWVALVAIAQVIRNGQRVMLVDLEDEPGSIVARLRILGLTDQQIAGGLDYRRPQAPFTGAAVAKLVDDVRSGGHALVVIDSLGEAFALDGINEDRDNEVGPWVRRVLRPLADTGAAVLVIDHSTKAGDGSLHPSGSKRKRAAVSGASYLVEATKPLSKGTGGRLRITCAKDRHGRYARREVVANVVMSVTDTGTNVELYAVDNTTQAEPADTAVRVIAEQVVRLVKDSPVPLSKTGAREALTVKARSDRKRAGVEYAISSGAVAVTEGPRGAHHLTYVHDLEDDEK
jgi:hypothetical protein